MKLLTDQEIQSLAETLSGSHNLTQKEAEKVIAASQRLDPTVQVLTFALALVDEGVAPDLVVRTMTKAYIAVAGRKDELIEALGKRANRSAAPDQS